MRHYILAIMTVVSFISTSCTLDSTGYEIGITQMSNKEFPKEIKVIEMYDQSTRLESVDNYPTPLFYFKNGERVMDESDADEIIPVVEVHLLSLDSEGNLVPTEKAQVIKIIEYGPEEKFLQSTVANTGN